MNKDWSDAVRESCYKEEIHPSDSGWEGITRKMHRNSVRRAAATVLAILAIPAAGLFMLPSQTGHSIQIVSGTSGHSGLLLSSYETILVESPVEGPSKQAVLENRTSTQIMTVDVTAKPVPDNSATTETNDSATGHEAVQAESKPKADNNHHKQTQDQPDPFRFPGEETQKHKAVHSVKLFGGSGLAATANFMNSNNFILPGDGYSPSGGGYYHGSASDGLTERTRGLPDDSKYHHLPISFGVSALIHLHGHLSLETGLTYTQVSTTYSHYDRTEGQSAYHKIEQTVRNRYLGIPVKLDYIFQTDNRFSYLIGIGGMAERCIRTDINGVSMNSSHSPLKFSLGVSAAVQYQLFKNVSLYFEPDFSYYLSKPEALELYRQDHKASFTVRSGFFINIAQ